MKLVGIILAAGIGLMAFKAGIVLAAILTPAILMWLAISNPYQFWGHAILFSLIAWANAYPAAGLWLVGCLCLASGKSKSSIVASSKD